MTERSRRSRAARSSRNFGGDTAIPALPKAPAMPLKPYMRYSREVWDQVKAENPHMMMWEMGRVIGEMWRALPEAVRNQYFEDYEARNTLYKEAMKRYYSSPAYLAWKAANAKEAENHSLDIQTKSQKNKETFHDEERVEERKIFLRELSPLKDEEENTVPQGLELLMNTHEEESKGLVPEFIPLKIKEEVNAATDEVEQYIQVKQEVCEDEDSTDATPAISLDRLKSLLASQLKTSPSRGSRSTTTEASSATHKSNGPANGMGSLLRCDHCISYFTREELAAHLHKEICQNFYCRLCSRKFGTKAQFALHLCISGKMLARYDSGKMRSEELVSLCTICGEQFLNNRKLISHLMTHRVKCDADVQPAKFRSREEATTNFSRHKPGSSKLCLKRRHPCDP